MADFQIDPIALLLVKDEIYYWRGVAYLMIDTLFDCSIRNSLESEADTIPLLLYILS